LEARKETQKVVKAVKSEFECKPVDMAAFTKTHYGNFDDYPLIKELKGAGILEEFEHLRKSGIPRCPVCKNDFERIDKYSWKPACGHCKGLILSIG